MTGLRIVAVCSLCGYEYASWFNETELDEHMAEAHGMRFEPGSLRIGDPPRWVSCPRSMDQAAAVIPGAGADSR